MTPSLNDIAVAEERRRELLRQAAQVRTEAALRAALAASGPARPGLRRRALASLGRLLVAWGLRLQEPPARV